jgi:uncharacterized protein (AIM24 family)
VTDLQQFDETTSTDAFTLQNGKLLKVRLAATTIQAKRGSMVAYQGDVKFEAVGSGGVSKFIKKAVTGEGQTLMRMSGSGEVFLADQAQDVHLMHLQNDVLTVNGPNLLAFDADIDWDIQRVQGGGAMMGGGLFNTALKGTGWVAVLTDGPPVRLDVGSAPTFADAQAAVAWSSGVSTSIRTDMGGLGSMIRGGSGETFQIAFSGAGWVLVQPSEGRIAGAANGSGGSAGSSGGLGGLLRG